MTHHDRQTHPILPTLSGQEPIYIYNTMWFLLTYHTYYANMIIYIYIHIIYIYIHVDYTGLTQQIKFCANKSGFESHVLKLSPHALRFVEYIYIYNYIYTHTINLYIYIYKSLFSLFTVQNGSKNMVPLNPPNHDCTYEKYHWEGIPGQILRIHQPEMCHFGMVPL